MENLVAQSIGFFALAIIVMVFQVNRRRHMLYLKAAASVLFAIHFGLLGAWTGAAMNGVNVARCSVFSLKNQYKWAHHIFWLFFFIALLWTAGILSWQGYISLLPMAGMTFGSIAFWMTDKRKIRLIALMTPMMWFTYNYMSGSYPGMATDTLLFISNVIGIVRFDLLGGKGIHLKKPVHATIPIMIHHNHHPEKH